MTSRGVEAGVERSIRRSYRFCKLTASVGARFTGHFALSTPTPAFDTELEVTQ